MPTQITDNQFESEALKSEIPVLVDFWAPWCGPCKAIAPVLEEIAKEFEGKIKIMKINVDENPATPSKYGIRAIPTLILFKDGEVAGQVTGAVSKSNLKEMVTEKGLS
ncbi:MAG: thioredoxin [Desulfohalobiaceae bacterium]|nr:thioredoxin [Desulfohalobiaceae bacterium]